MTSNAEDISRMSPRIHVVFALLLAAAGVLAYSNNFTAEFVYDDYPFIIENPGVRSLSNPLRFFVDRESFSSKGSYIIYRPLATLSFASNHKFSGYNPASYHAVNISLHVVCGLLVYLLFYITFRHAAYAFLVSLLFLVHPVQTEAVAWISGRGNPMFLSFLLLALVCYRNWSVKKRPALLFYGLALLFAALSLLSKEMAVVLPVLLAVYDATLNRPQAREQWKRRLLGIFPFAFLSAGYVLARHLVLGETGQIGYWGGSIWTALLTMTKGFAYYVRLMFMPRPLMVEYVVPLVRSMLQPTFLFSIIILLGIAAICFFSRKRAPVVSFGIAWFFASLLPVSNIVPLKAIINERFLYLPSIGFCAILASPLLFIRPSMGRVTHRWIIAALLLIALCYGVLAFDRNQDWRNSLSLWTASVQSSPAGATSRYNLGLELYKRRRYDEAVEHLKIACLLQEKFSSAHGVLGNVYFAQGRYEEAIREFEIGLSQASDPRIRHNLAVVWFEKGKVQASKGEMAAAADSFIKALSYEPEFQPAREMLEEIRAAHDSETTSEAKSNT